MERLKQIVFDLTSSHGVSGDEKCAVETAQKYLKKFGKCHTDKLGNLICEVIPHKNGYEHILLDAHIDEIGLMVTGVTEDGFLRITGVGGVDTRIMSAAQVTVHGKRDLFGVITNKPPHLTKPEQYRKAEPIENMYIDIGYNKQQAEEYVSIGDRVTFNGDGTNALDDRVISKALDDRIGCAAIIRVLELVKQNELNCGLTVMFSTREEVGSQGAKTGTFAIGSVTTAIAVDITFGDSPYAGKEKCGEIGAGPMIGISPVLDKSLSNELIEIAKEKSIPYDLEVMCGLTHTTADQIMITKCGIPTALVSIPERYAHMPIEMVDMNDVENTAKLIASFIIKRGEA